MQPNLVAFECRLAVKKTVKKDLETNTEKTHRRTVTLWLSSLPAAVELHLIEAPEVKMVDDAGSEDGDDEGEIKLSQDGDDGLAGREVGSDYDGDSTPTEIDSDSERGLDQKYTKPRAKPTRVLPKRAGRAPTGDERHWTIRFEDDIDVRGSHDSSSEQSSFPK